MRDGKTLADVSQRAGFPLDIDLLSIREGQVITLQIPGEVMPVKIICSGDGLAYLDVAMEFAKRDVMAATFYLFTWHQRFERSVDQMPLAIGRMVMRGWPVLLKDFLKEVRRRGISIPQDFPIERLIHEGEVRERELIKQA